MKQFPFLKTLNIFFATALSIGFTGSIPGLTHAFITGPNGVGMTDLNSLLELPEGTVLVRADGINNHGQIIARGTTSLVPEPQSYALMLAGLALVGLMLRREFHVV